MFVALDLKYEKRYSIALIREKQISNYVTETTIKFHVVTIRITSLETKKAQNEQIFLKMKYSWYEFQGDSVVIQHSFLLLYFVHFWLCCVFAAARAFSSCGEQGYPSLGVRASLRSDLSAAEHGLQEMWLPALEHRLAFGPSCSRACGFSHIRDWTRVSHTGRQILHRWATREALGTFYSKWTNLVQRLEACITFSVLHA